MFPTCVTTPSLSEPARVGDRHTVPARSPHAGGIPARAIGLPGTMFDILGVNPVGLLSSNSYHPSPKVSNINSVTQSCPTLCDPMNRSTEDLPVCHQLLKFTQTHENIPWGQIFTLFLWNILSAASYQFVFKPLTNSYNHDPASSVGNISSPSLLLKYS